MNLENLEVDDLSINKSIDILSSLNEIAKRSMFLEIVSLVYSDNQVATKEKELIDSTALKFSISKDKEKFIKAVEELQNIYGDIFDLVFID